MWYNRRMKKNVAESRIAWLLPPMAAAAGLAVAAAVFFAEARSFREAVKRWATRDLESRAELAAANLLTPLATGDFRTIRAFGDDCAEDGVRLTVLSAPGGTVFDSSANPEGMGSFIYSSRPCGEFTVRLGLPMARVLAPYSRARTGFLLAAIAGGAGVFVVALFVFRQRVRILELGAERDSQMKIVAELKKQEEFRRDFIADVSHEIKTPLTGILGAAELLSSPEPLPAESQKQLIGMICQESQRLNSLAQSILALARLERRDGADPADFAETDLAGIVCDTAGRFARDAAAKGISLKIDAPEPCTADIDSCLVESAVANLVNNAIIHSHAANVRISLSATAETARITVEDDGIGIPEAHRQRIFDRFHRVDAARSGDTGGSGLGLAIVRKIAAVHGGSASFEPSEPTGSRFAVELPRRRQTADSTSLTDAESGDSTFTDSEIR